MSNINISNLIVRNNPSPFLAPFCFSVTFECLQPIKEEVEWKVIYVGSPKDEKYDQVIDTFSIGPFPEGGIMQFDIESSPPDYSKIPEEDLLGVSAIIHSVSYEKQEFFRVGYFVYNNYEDPFLVENPPYPAQVDKIVRSILADKPRIIRHNIDWESESSEKIKALNHILMENSNILNADNGINFKGMFSDIEMGNQSKTEDNKFFGGFDSFSWNNNNNNNNNFQNNNNGFGFGSNNGMMNGNNQSFGNGLFNNQNQYNQSPFMNQSNGGFGLFSGQTNNENFGYNDGGQRFGNGFMETNNMGNMMQGGMNFPSM